MSVTPQTNIDLPALAAEIKLRDNFVICGHVSPDGDCIGSQLALWHALRALGKQVTCVLARDEAVDARLLFLPGASELIPAMHFEGVADSFIAVDVPLASRIGDAATKILEGCSFSATVDHHAVENRMTERAYVDPDTASTTMLVWELIGYLGVDRSGAIATCAYTGLVTDTGRFQYQNTDKDAFAAAGEMVEAGANPSDISREIFQNRSLPSVQLEARAVERMCFGAEGRVALSCVKLTDFEQTGASKFDAEPLIDTLRSLQGVEIACMLREQSDSIRGSLRAKTDADVAAIARILGGGGHRAAAGFTLYKPLDEAVAFMNEVLARSLEETEGDSALTTARLEEDSSS